MLKIDELFKAIDEKESEFINIWQDVCNIESPTEYKKGVDAVGNYFAKYAKAQGWDVEKFVQECVGDCVCITMNKENKNKPITLSGHIDTVHPVGSFGTPAVRMDENNIYGPGVMDCKGGAVAALMAMTALKTIGFTDRPIRLILQTDEEVNSALSGKKTINYICEKAADSEAFLNCESTRGNTAVLWRKGILRYLFEVFGQSIHASRCAEGGASAVREAAYKIIELEKMKDKDGLTFNCGIINGGTSANTVPDFCSFTAEIRFSTKDELLKGEEMFKTVAEKTYVDGTSCKITEICSRPAMEKCERNFKLLEKINEIYKACGLPELTARQSLGGSDAAEVTQSGIPCVDSIGVAGDKIHTPQEYAILSSLAEAAKRIAAVCFMI